MDFEWDAFKKSPMSPQETHPGFGQPDVSSCQGTVTLFSSIEKRVLDFTVVFNRDIFRDMLASTDNRGR